MVEDQQTYEIIGAAIEVHRTMGHGFLEAVYQESLEKEFLCRRIPFRREFPLQVSYKGHVLTTSYQADFLCYGEIIVELKAIGQIGSKDKAQVINYLKASGLQRGLLLNFGAPRLECERVVLSDTKKDAIEGKESSADNADLRR